MRILTEPKNALVKQFQRFFALDSVELELHAGGARGLRRRGDPPQDRRPRPAHRARGHAAGSDVRDSVARRRQEVRRQRGDDHEAPASAAAHAGRSGSGDRRRGAARRERLEIFPRPFKSLTPGLVPISAGPVMQRCSEIAPSFALHCLLRWRPLVNLPLLVRPECYAIEFAGCAALDEHFGRSPHRPGAWRCGMARHWTKAAGLVLVSLVWLTALGGVQRSNSGPSTFPRHMCRPTETFSRL